MTSSPRTRLELSGYRFRAMGSPCSIQVYAGTSGAALDGIRDAVARIEALERKYSRFLKGNLFDRVNRAAGRGASHPIDEEFAALLDYADACHRNSGGLFDITSGVLRRAWDFKSGKPPGPGQVEALMDCVGWRHVSWSRSEIRFARKNMEIDFGGIVKEYAADTAAAILESHGLRHGLLDMGGDIKVIGPHPDGTPWTIGIRHPRRPGAVMASLDITRGALATSGDYERCIVLDGQRYSHILDPRTGWPVQGMAGVSVVADQCVVAGSSCTIAMLKGREAPAWLAGMGVAHIGMDVDGRIFPANGGADARSANSARFTATPAPAA